MSRLRAIAILSFPLLLVIGWGGYGHGQRAPAAPGPQAVAHLRQGIEKTFNMEENSAIQQFMKCIELDRENPLGDAYLSLACLYFYEMGFTQGERERNQGLILRSIGEALSKGERRLGKDPRDSDAVWAMTLAKLAKARWEMAHRRFLSAALEMGNLEDYLEKVRELAPQNYDVFYPMGLLHYHADRLTGFVRLLSSFVVSGDRQKGLQELTVAAEKGPMLKDLAKAELLFDYYNFEAQPGRALPLAKELRAKYPRNYDFLFALTNIFSDLGRPADAFSTAGEIERGITSGQPPFRPELWPRYWQLMGKVHFDQKEYAEASRYLTRSLEDTSRYNARVRAWAFVRLGMIHDLRNERALAEADYRKALAVEGGAGVAQMKAKKYLKTPYSP